MLVSLSVSLCSWVCQMSSIMVPRWQFGSPVQSVEKMLLNGIHSHWSLESIQLGTFYLYLGTWAYVCIMFVHFFTTKRGFCFLWSFLQHWEVYQAALIEEVKTVKDAVWCGDGRFDSMGHSATILAKIIVDTACVKQKCMCFQWINPKKPLFPLLPPIQCW